MRELLSGYLTSMKLVALLVVLLALLGAVAFMRTRRATGGTYRVPDGRDRPMTAWVDEQAQPDTGEGVPRKGAEDLPSS